MLTSAPINILLDAGIFMHSEIAENATRLETVKWGPATQSVEIHGYVRKALSSNPKLQAEKDALFTIGRLIREGRIIAFRYGEIAFELCRAANPVIVNALAECKILHCDPPIVRSKFRQTIQSEEIIRKGGKKDRDAGNVPSEFNQIPWLTWLKDLTPNEVTLLMEHQAELNLTSFEVQSFRELNWFQVLCDRSQSPENYVDVFHLWTAERNGLSFLTLDQGIQNLVARVKTEKRRSVDVNSTVYLPTDLLRAMAVSQPDPVPMELGRFYGLGDGIIY